MKLTPLMFIIVCPMLFAAGFVDAIGGGGGLISLPAYLFAGLPVHMAIATNKLSSSCGTALATGRFIRQGLVNFRLAVPSVVAAVLGSSLGARLSLAVSEEIMKSILLAVLPVAAFIVLNKHLFRNDGKHTPVADRRTMVICIAAAFVIGIYDGFYGPGTGTFLIIAFTVLARMTVESANAQTKVINLTTNITSLTFFLLNGQVLFPLGLVGALCNMAGNWVGSGLAITKGTKIVRPFVLLVLLLLLAKILFNF